MSGIPLLSEAWRDIIAVGSLIVTVIGFWLAIWQIRKTKSAALAAQEAANRSFEESRNHFQRYVISCSTRFLAESTLYASNKSWDKAGLRLGDLADQVSQLTDTDQSWSAFLKELREWETAFNSMPGRKIAIRKWTSFLERFQSKVDSHHGPYKDISG
jgi:hypothetical protein